MNFDVVIIGGGLAGLTCGIALQKKGKQCVIINNGQAAIDFSSGSMDLLGQLPSGEIVQSFRKSFTDLQTQLPNHPYNLLGGPKVLEKAQKFQEFATSLNLGLKGSTEENHFRVTPLGALKKTWLSPDNVPTVSENDKFPHTHIAILGIESYHDFQPQMLAANLPLNSQFAHCKVSTGYLSLPELDELRVNSREFRSVHISQTLEHRLAFQDLVREIKKAAGNATSVFLPACFGIDNNNFFNKLKQATGLELFEIPTLPPSLLGIRQHSQLRHEYTISGGISMNGNQVLSSKIDNGKVTEVMTSLYPNEPITAEHFVLAAGSFFSSGIVSEFEKIYEPIFNADITGNETFEPSNRLSWTETRFSSPQPYQSAGVIINEHCQIRKEGQFINNLYGIGNIIGGYNNLELGCSSGVSIVTALSVADEIGG